jgi:hypothetical protein
MWTTGGLYTFWPEIPAVSGHFRIFGATLLIHGVPDEFKPAPVKAGTSRRAG